RRRRADALRLPSKSRPGDRGGRDSRCPVRVPVHARAAQGSRSGAGAQGELAVRDRKARGRRASRHRRQVHGRAHREHGRGRGRSEGARVPRVSVSSAGQAREASDEAPREPRDAGPDRAGNPRPVRDARGRRGLPALQSDPDRLDRGRRPLLQAAGVVRPDGIGELAGSDRSGSELRGGGAAMTRRLLAFVFGLAAAGLALGQSAVIKADRVLDGKGAALTGPVWIVVEDGRIRKIAPSGEGLRSDWDLSGLTLLPGLIDVHDHVGWHFNKGGRLHTDSDGETPAEGALAGAANAWTTLQAGFTTIQSPGSDSDRELREAIASGALPGPRILTTLEPLNEKSGPPAELRELVRKRAASGADAIKLFASKSIRDGGAQTMTQDQLDAACGE